MSVTEWVVTGTLRRVSRILCRVDDHELARIPARGPLILVVNHVNFLDAPLMYSHLRPRPVTGFAKVETWDNPAMGWLFNVFQAIPLRRGEADTGAFRKALEVLARGEILGVAPEGTRSNDGRLRHGKPGVVMLALRSGAPLQPAAYHGSEHFHHNIRRLQRTEFNITVGYPFYLDACGERITREVRHKMTHEIMYQLAAILPPAYRGQYANLEAATENYLRFPPGSQSNLARAATFGTTWAAVPAQG
jgi:1-acyl-sn-glycerol-3-phosphate acyltransferase